MKLIRFAVVGLCIFGVGAGAYAIGRLAGVFPPSPLPPYAPWTALHFSTAIVFASLLPLQLWPALRARRPALHRWTGRFAAGVGAVMAASGVSMAYLVPERPVAEKIFMTAFFLTWSGMLALGVRAAMRRDIETHRAWMARMTATSLTPLVQRLIFPAFALGVGIDGLATFWQLFVSAAWIAWALSLATAEVWLRGRPAAARLGVA